jgi:hypothetical protein
MSVNQRLTSSQVGNARTSLEHNQVNNRPLTLPYLPQTKHLGQPSTLDAPLYHPDNPKNMIAKYLSKAKKKKTKKSKPARAK